MFLEKRPVSSVPKVSPPHRLTLLCSNIVKFVQRKIGEIVRYLPHKNSTASETVATARIAPKICQSQPPTFGSHCSRFHPNQITFDGVIAERVNTVLLPRREFPIFAFGRIIKIIILQTSYTKCKKNTHKMILQYRLKIIKIIIYRNNQSIHGNQQRRTHHKFSVDYVHGNRSKSLTKSTVRKKIRILSETCR